MQAQREGDWCSETRRGFFEWSEMAKMEWVKGLLSNTEKIAGVGNYVFVMNMGTWQYLTA